MNIYSEIVLLVAKLNTLCPTQTSRLYQTYRIECSYNHIPRRPQRPPLQNKTTQYTPDEFQKRQFLLAEQALQRDDTLWQLVLSEGERLKQAIEEAREVVKWDMNETYRDGQEEVRLEDVQDAVSGLEGQSVPPIAGDEPPNEVQRGESMRSFGASTLNF